MVVRSPRTCGRSVQLSRSGHRASPEAAEPSVMRKTYDHTESARRFTALLKTYPDDAELLYWSAWNYSELGEHDKLLPIVDRMAAIDPTSAVAQSSRALTLFY